MTARVVLVTGASRGIGAAIASSLLESGHTVVGTHRGSGVPPGVLGACCDMDDPAGLAAAVAQVTASTGSIEAVVACAGITDDMLAVRVPADRFERVLRTNLVGAYAAVQHVLAPMLRRRFGRIVLVGSVVGASGSPGQASYAASKAGMVGLARSLARECGGRGVTANVVAPGFVETDMTAALDEPRRRELLAATPLCRPVTADEVAAVVAFLISDGAAAVTGALVPVDGGLGMGH